MVGISTLYGHLKTLTSQWFYTKEEIGQGYLAKSNTAGLVKNDGSIDTSVYLKKTDAIGVGSFTELQTLITNATAGDVIILKKDYKNTGSESRITIGKNLTIIGNGHTIDADGKSQIFSINEGTSSAIVTVTIIGVNFINGIGTGGGNRGGAIDAIQYNRINVFDCSFTNNSQTSSQTGGAIYCHEYNTIMNCTFNNNTATSGAAISCYKASNQLISNCIFKDNSGGTGNDVYCSSQGLVICNCETSSANLYNTTNKVDINASDIVDNLTTNDATKVLSAKQGYQLNALIGNAISYINQ